LLVIHLQVSYCSTPASIAPEDVVTFPFWR
jgi:hypothetical protein